MDQLIPGEQDIEAGLAHVTQQSSSDTVEVLNFGASEKIDDDADDLNYPLIGNENPTETTSSKRNDIVKVKKSRKASKPPRPPKGPSFTANDHKVMKEIAELAMRKRARIEMMKNSLRRIKAAKSSSSSPYSCISIFSVVVTALFFGFLLFQGNMTMSSDNSPAPTAKDVEGAEELCRILSKWRPLDSETVTFLIKTYAAAEKTCPDMRERLFREQIEDTIKKLSVLGSRMDQLIPGEQDIEAGLAHVTQQSSSDTVEVLNFGASEKIDDDADDLNYPLIGNENPTETTSSKRNDIVKVKKSRKAASKPPRPPKGPSFTANDHKVMKEIAELAMRKRARIERMKNSLRRIKAAKSSSSSLSSSSPYSCISIFSVVVTALFFGFLLFQGLFAGNMTMSSDNSPAPTGSPNNQLISKVINNVDQVDVSQQPTMIENLTGNI
ncbi:hypothetical protein DY000_02044235 [Brassica cretica]|uniref:Transmembrane protein n=1 Tax=Brassica cretica TaxID=69181 RepID=A0ABQ7F746_BRACR|nr:hypothetical protein DY000_02044235 [Brassica cretica]